MFTYRYNSKVEPATEVIRSRRSLKGCRWSSRVSLSRLSETSELSELSKASSLGKNP